MVLWLVSLPTVGFVASCLRMGASGSFEFDICCYVVFVSLGWQVVQPYDRYKAIMVPWPLVVDDRVLF